MNIIVRLNDNHPDSLLSRSHRDVDAPVVVDGVLYIRSNVTLVMMYSAGYWKSVEVVH